MGYHHFPLAGEEEADKWLDLNPDPGDLICFRNELFVLEEALCPVIWGNLLICLHVLPETGIIQQYGDEPRLWRTDCALNLSPELVTLD